MYIVLGGTGHVGTAVAGALLAAGEPVTIVSRDTRRAEPLRRRGAAVAAVDVRDGEALRAVLRGGSRAFLLNPPADPSGDTDSEERATAAAIVGALDGSGLEMIVAEFNYGAQPGECLGDLSVLYEFETALRAQPIPVTVLRAAFYMSNWDALLEAVRHDGVLPTPYPANLALPMVAPADIGRAAAGLLIKPPMSAVTQYVEGPERYTTVAVAAAFAAALGRPVQLAVTPRDGWQAAYRALGFSTTAADAYARMTAVTVDGRYTMPETPWRGDVTLQGYIAALVARGSGGMA